MSAEAAASAATSDVEELCVVCFKAVDLYSVGVCDHPVCYECSTRMRVVCHRKECPICRGEMPEVVFTKEVKPFKDLVPNPNITESSQGIQFMSRSIQDAYYKLLDQVCNDCGRRFRSFAQLKDHMRKEHELFYCDLCVKNLMIFSFERRCYTRAELGIHRRKGDPDNTSHRGHPICEFCDERYMDNDHLFRHLRRDHLYCHFCDADGKHQYYRNYTELREHFLEDHYLCEQGDCESEMLTSVFRSDIDLKAHIMTAHSKHLGRAANKQARTLELEFNFKPRRNQQHPHHHHQHEQQQQHQHAPDESNNRNVLRNRRPMAPPTEEILTLPEDMIRRPPTAADFPSLGGNGNETSVSSGRASVTFTSKMSRPRFNTDEFPTLGGGLAAGNVGAPSVSASTGAVSRNPRNITITKTSASEVRKATSVAGVYNSGRNLALNKQNFPTLQAESSTGNSFVKLTVQPTRPIPPSNVSIQLNHDRPGSSSSTSIQVRPKSMAEAFPVLGGGSAALPSDAMQWVPPKPRRLPETKVTKVAKAPQLPRPAFVDFPTLGGKKTEKKSSSVTMPIRSVPESNDKQKKQEKPENNNTSNENNNAQTTVNSTKKDKSQNQKKKEELTNSSRAKTINTTSASANSNKNKKVLKQEFAEGANGASDAENSLVKKTSTLTIGNLGQGSVPPGFIKPPPGFGFVNNDLTFTSSSGQSYSIQPTDAPQSREPRGPRYIYFQPPNFQNRNATLIQHFINVLKTQECMDEFKSYSLLFRRGEYSADKYLAHCETVLADEFDNIFPELLVLLPDITRQQELYRALLTRGKPRHIDTCGTCQQIIFTNELKHHMNSHYMENHFPGLKQETGRPDAWRK